MDSAGLGGSCGTTFTAGEEACGWLRRGNSARGGTVAKMTKMDAVIPMVATVEEGGCLRTRLLGIRIRD